MSHGWQEEPGALPRMLRYPTADPAPLTALVDQLRRVLLHGEKAPLPLRVLLALMDSADTLRRTPWSKGLMGRLGPTKTTRQEQMRQLFATTLGWAHLATTNIFV